MYVIHAIRPIFFASDEVSIWEPERRRPRGFSGYRRGTAVPLQYPFRGGVSPLQPARSAVFVLPPAGEPPSTRNAGADRDG